jgi:hypothetical protein
VLARFIARRLLELAAAAFAVAVIGWWLDGGLGRLAGGGRRNGWRLDAAAAMRLAAGAGRGALDALAAVAAGVGWRPLVCALLVAAGVLAMRGAARRRRRYARLRVEAYRGDEASAEGIVAMYESLHQRLARRWWRRLLLGQPSLALEIHRDCGRGGELWLAVCCPCGLEGAVESALRGAYPNCALRPAHVALGAPPALLRLRKQGEPIKRVGRLDRYEHERQPPMNRLMRAMAACDGSAYVQVALTPAPLALERVAHAAYRRHEREVSWRAHGGRRVRERSLYDEVELKGGLELQHAPLFFCDLRVVARDLHQAERVAAELRAHPAENRFSAHRTGVRQALAAPYDRRVQRGEGNPLPPLLKGVLAPRELAPLWHLPSIDHASVPFARASVPVAPAPPGVCRPRAGAGMLRDALGPVSIHESCRRQNTAVPGAVEQGKSSLLVASIAEDLRRERCAVILLDPKGDAADAALSAVPAERTCTVLDFASPTCGFNPLAADVPPDVVADYAVGALRNLFTDADIRASSDRYLRNAIIAALAYDRRATLWDAARLLSVGDEGKAFRAFVGARVRGMPELKEITEFFSAELATQLEDARSATTAKLDAPANKLARLLNSASIKRVLLNDSLAVDLDRVIARGEVLIVKGALGAMGAGNTATLMQMIVGMLDAALARQQDRVAPSERVAVALKIDEAPLVINRGFAETLALKRSAGLETMACWQTDAQWTDREIRDQLDALFANRVYFATASVRDARSAASLMMAEFSDSVRPGARNISALGRPDARLHLPRHHAIASLVTPAGRQRPFVARTIPMRVDEGRIELHLARQAERGGRYLDDLRQPHWERLAEERARGATSEGGSRSSRRTGPTQSASARDPGAPVPARSGSAPATSAPAASTPATSTPATSTPARPPDSYRELVDLDRASTLRLVASRTPAATVQPDRLELAMLAFVARVRYALASQLHRRFAGGQALTTTQRRLKRLADGGLLARLQFHRRDGGGIPMCYALTPAGRDALRSAPSARGSSLAGVAEPHAEPPPLPRSTLDTRVVAQVRHELHVAGWLLAAEALLTTAVSRRLDADAVAILGPAEAVLPAPTTTDVRLPGGRIPHDFLRTEDGRRRVPAERFETVRPDGLLAASERPVDLLVELDDRLPVGHAARKLERYDHFLSGWAGQAARFRHTGRSPRVVFVCRDRPRARECARCADAVLVAAQAYAGEYRSEWRYPGREGIVFAAERDAHEGVLVGYAVPPLPPAVRLEASGAHAADDRARACTAEPRLRDLLADLGPGTRAARPFDGAS